MNNDDFEKEREGLTRRLVAYFRTRGCDGSLAEDLAQETLVRFWLNLDRYDPSRPLWPWVLAIGYNCWRDDRRTRRRRPLDFARHGEDGSLPVEELADRDEAGPEVTALTSELRQGIEDCMNKLPEELRVLFGLTLELPNSAEVAGLLDIDINRVYRLTFSARRSLEACLRNKGLI